MTSATESFQQGRAPLLSVVIPVFNEEGILREAVTELCRDLRGSAIEFEVLLAENGSTDATAAVAEALADEMPEVRSLSIDEPNYGRALREGISRAQGRYVVCDEIDLCDTEFQRRALELLRAGDAEMVVGSKAMPGASDERPLLRRAATRVMSGLLRVVLDFRGTDTHGLKAFSRERLVPIAESCVVEHDLFASEFVIRAGRDGVRLVEIPVRVAEKRPPAINLARRVPGVFANLAVLTYAIRVRGRR